MSLYKTLIGILPIIYIVGIVILSFCVIEDKEKKIRYVSNYVYFVINGFIMLIYVMLIISNILYDTNNMQVVTDLLIKDKKIEYKVNPVTGETYISLKDSTMKNSYKFIKNIK